MKIQFIMMSNGIGGAEKRYANLFNYVSSHSTHEYSLAINRRLWELLSDCSISFDHSHCFVMKDFWPYYGRTGNRFSALWNKFACSPTANLPYCIRQIRKHFQKNGEPDHVSRTQDNTLLLWRVITYYFWKTPYN